MDQNPRRIEQDTFVAPLIMDYNNDTLPKHVPSPQHLLSTTSDQAASIIPQLLPLPVDKETVSTNSAETTTNVVTAPNTTTTESTSTQNQPITNTETSAPAKPEPTTTSTTNLQETATTNTVTAVAGPAPVPSSSGGAAEEQKDSRWTKENRVILKQLMGSLPPHDIGAALRVILDTFGVESSKLVRRGNYVELDLSKINDDYILDSLWNYCAQMQYNIMNTLQAQQQQQIQQQLQFQQMQQQQQMVPPPQVPTVQAVQMSPQQAINPMMPQNATNQMPQQFMNDQQTLDGMVMPMQTPINGNADVLNQQFLVMDPSQQMRPQ